MTDFLIIVIITLAVVLAFGIFALCRAASNRDRAWREVVRRKEQDLARAELFRKEAEWRYGELVETVATRTDQAAGEKAK